MRRLVSLCLLGAIVGISLAIPKIISRGETIGVFRGQAAMLTCRISNPKDGVATWSSVTNGFKIYQGDQFLANDSDKYSLFNIAGGQIYNLQILNIEKSDEGLYKCAIEGTNVEIITQLQIKDIEAASTKVTDTNTVTLYLTTDSTRNDIDHTDANFTTASTIHFVEQTGDNTIILVGMAVGISMSVICLTLITILAISLCCRRRFQDNVAFENPSFNHFKELHAQVSHVCEKQQLDAPDRF